MKITVLNGRDLAPAQWERWGAIQREVSELDNPYFCPDYTRLVSAVREDIFVAVLGNASDPEGFFPFQRRRFGFGQPVGNNLCDFQGVIARSGVTVDVPELMRACGLVTWDFHSLLVSQAAFAPYHLEKYGSHYLDLPEGLEGYERVRRAAGSDQPRRMRSLRKKALEKYKKVEFVPHTTDVKVLDQLLEWKSKQYQDSGTLDNWSFDWMRDLAGRIHAHQGENFSGALSALYFDGELAAAHLGMRSRTSWHWWIPRHDERLSDMRPGLIMLHMMMEHAPAWGVKRIDLGYGDEEYKRRLKSGEIAVAKGRVEMPSIGRSMRRWREGLETWIRKTPLLPVVRFPGRILKRLEKWNRYR